MNQYQKIKIETPIAKLTERERKKERGWGGRERGSIQVKTIFENEEVSIDGSTLKRIIMLYFENLYSKKAPE